MSYQSPKEIISKSIDILDAREFHRDFASIRLLNPVGSNDPQITFTRSTSATRVNESGFIENVNINTPRFDFDPITLNCKGLLLEEARTNLILRSEEFDNASWTRSNTNITANSDTSPDGTVDADLITTTAGSNNISQAVNITPSSTYTFSFWVKPVSGNTWIVIILYTFPSINGARCWFNLSGSGTATGAIANGTGTLGQVSIQQGINGWYKCSITTTPNGAETSFRCEINQCNGSGSYTSTVGDSKLVWGAQLEVGTLPTSYIPTTSATVTRAVDVAQVTGTNFSNFYNRNEGSFVVKCSWNSDVVYDSFIVMINQDGNNYLAIRRNNATNKFFNIRTTGFNNDIPVGFTETVFTTTRTYAAAYKINDSAFTYSTTSLFGNGATNVLPVPNSINFGGFSGGASGSINIASFSYYNRRLPDRIIRAFTL